MIATSTLGDMLSTLVERRPFGRKLEDGNRIQEGCLALLSETAEISGLQRAASILNQYATLDEKERVAFFTFLNDDLDIDPAAIEALAQRYGQDASFAHYDALLAACEPARQQLFRRLNEAPGATAELVRMRKDLIELLPTHPELARTDHDLLHLLKSWFNRGFLVMHQVSWDSAATILEKIIDYEAVHEIREWGDLRRRLQPSDRRCFAFFHPSMPTEPLIFVEVALCKGIPNSIQEVLSDNRQSIEDTQADTAVFYSISNCQAGLAGVSFGNSLIKQVARDLSNALPNLKTFVTLSPIPGLMKWVESQEIEAETDDPQKMERLAAKYLTEAKGKAGLPRDPVARFHLGNGASVHAVHAGADTSQKGMRQSAGVMVNYLYDLSRISQRATQFSTTAEVATSPSVRTQARRAG